jgi:hypothetical protein
MGLNLHGYWRCYNVHRKTMSFARAVAPGDEVSAHNSGN